MRLRSRWPVPAPMSCCWRVAGGTLTRWPISQGLGRRAVPAVMDLADADAITTTFAQVVADAGRLDVLVNVAATDVPGPVTDLGVRDWDHVLGVNLRAPFLLAKLAFPRMQAAGGGTIIKVTSVAGKRGWANRQRVLCVKVGLTGLTQALAAEGQAHGIRVCVLYPGAMATQWGTFDPTSGLHVIGHHRPPRRCLPSMSRSSSCGLPAPHTNLCSTRPSAPHRMRPVCHE
jgi:NAD(P)-dependent dehydrogenase (short-subunit alcohol dehydrogenase family)